MTATNPFDWCRRQRRLVISGATVLGIALVLSVSAAAQTEQDADLQTNWIHPHDEPFLLRIPGDERVQLRWSDARDGFEDHPPSRNSDRWRRVVRHETPVPGALRVEGGERQPWGSEIEVEVEVPGGLLLPPGEAWSDENRHKRALAFEVVALGRHVRGGAVRAEGVLSTIRLESPKTRFLFSQTEGLLKRMVPGLYELRVTSGKFVLDRHRLLISVDEVAGALRRIKPGEGAPPQLIEVVHRAEQTLAPGFWYGLDLVYFGPDGRHEKVMLSEAARIDPGEPVRIGAAARSGTYIVNLLLGDDGRGNVFVIDRLAIPVGAAEIEESFGGLYFAVAGQTVNGDFDEIVLSSGIPIDVEFSLQPAEDEQRRRMSSIDMAVEIVRQSDGRSVARWPVEVGLRTAWKLDESLPVGLYEIRLVSSFMGQSTPFVSRPLRMVPHVSATLELRDGSSVRPGGTVSLTARIVQSEAAADFETFVTGLRLGGKVPGCGLRVSDRLGEYSAVARSAEVAVFEVPVWGPGIYLFRLQRRTASNRVVRLAEAAVEVTVEPLVGTLQVGKTQLAPGEPLPVTVRLPEAEAERADQYRVVVVRHGVVARGGARAHASTLAGGKSLGRAAAAQSFDLRVPGSYGEQGSFEVRLLDCGRGDCTVVDIAPFTMVNPASPFALAEGLGSISLRNDLAVADNPWPPIGEFLNDDDCRPWNPRPERMELRYVKWENGEYVPIAEPIEFGQGFFVEGRLERSALRSSYFSSVTAGEDHGAQVLLHRTEDPTLVRSDLLYLIWDSNSEDEAGDAR